jgi:hypothetical protein
MNDSDDGFAGRYATATLCIKRLLEEGDVPITQDLLSIFLYSFTCFRQSNFETTLNRTMEMTMAYREFYRMTRHMSTHNVMFADVVMFILKGFPASAATNTCISPTRTTQEMNTFLRIIRELINDVINRYPEYKENPSMVTEEARLLYSRQSDETIVSGDIDTTNG